MTSWWLAATGTAACTSSVARCRRRAWRLEGQRMMSRPEVPAAVRLEAFPADPDFPHLTVASDPGLMLEVFRAHLKPVAGQRYHIKDCTPFRFRCRQSTSR